MKDAYHSSSASLQRIPGFTGFAGFPDMIINKRRIPNAIETLGSTKRLRINGVRLKAISKGTVMLLNQRP